MPGTPLTVVNLGKFWSQRSAIRTQRSRELMVEPAPGETEQPLGQENDHGNENQAHEDQVVFREEARQSFAQQQKECGADDGTDQGADPADDVEDDDLARNQKEDKIGRSEL